MTQPAPAAAPDAAPTFPIDPEMAAIMGRLADDVVEDTLPTGPVSETEIRRRISNLLALKGRVVAELLAGTEEFHAYLARLQERHEERQRPLERTLLWLDETLRGLFPWLPVHKGKSVRLLTGTVGEREQPERFTVHANARPAQVIDELESLLDPDDFERVIRRKRDLDAKGLTTVLSELRTVARVEVHDGAVHLRPLVRGGDPAAGLPVGEPVPLQTVVFVPAHDRFYATPNE